MPTPPWLNVFVWTDYRLAVIFAVIIPLLLLLWSTITGVNTVQRLMIIYWRVSSLLAISVYLLIAALPIGFITGFLSRFLVPLGLWFWADINEAIEDLPKTPLRLAVRSWRWAMTVYFAIAGCVQVTSLPCTLLAREALLENTSCKLWLKAPWGYKAVLHPTTTPGFLGFLGIVGLVIYVLYIANFVLFRFRKQGRLALED
jgi:hypothetical protein